MEFTKWCAWDFFYIFQNFEFFDKENGKHVAARFCLPKFAEYLKRHTNFFFVTYSEASTMKTHFRIRDINSFNAFSKQTQKFIRDKTMIKTCQNIN